VAGGVSLQRTLPQPAFAGTRSRGQVQLEEFAEVLHEECGARPMLLLVQLTLRGQMGPVGRLAVWVSVAREMGKTDPQSLRLGGWVG